MGHHLRSVVAAFALTGALAACSSDDAKSTPTTAASSSTAPSTASSSPVTSGPGSTSATGATPSSAAGTTGGDDQRTGEFCTTAKKLASYNESTPTPNFNQPFDALKQQLSTTISDSLTLYDDTIADAPAEIEAEIKTLRQVTVDTLDLLEQSSSAADLQAAFTKLLTPEVSRATTKLNTFLTDECGFGLTSG